MWKKSGVTVLACLLTMGLPAFVLASNLKAEEYFREGYMASMAREWDSAIASYTRSIELDPNNPESYMQRAAALEMADRIDEAIDDYNKTLRLKPDYYLAMEYLAKLYESKGEYAKAVDLYAEALKLVTDAKWRSVVMQWMSDARKKIKQGGREHDKTTGRRHDRRN
ncbi:MAG: tetratricopeptide repeat protein [Desulfomonilaceae bacterium]|nr:tetratricopeptide repeat protein [Desulfomonilaceae bacterium]